MIYRDEINQIKPPYSVPQYEVDLQFQLPKVNNIVIKFSLFNTVMV
jgi:hypothetical protein